MAASLALVGCSSEENVLNGGTDPAAGETGYVAVNIVQPKSIGTRASTVDYENGTADENLAREGLFFILNSTGQVQGSPQRVALDGKTVEESNPAVERIYSAVLLIDGVSTDPSDNTKEIICILNAPVNLENNVSSLADLKAKVEDYCTDKTDAGTFVMSNSVYKDAESKIIIGTPVDAAKVKTSASAALADPVDIYVERVVAQVRAKEKSGGMTNDGVTLPIDGKDTKFNIVIDGMALSNLSDKANLIKDISSYTETSWDWNSTTNFRSFWEVMPPKKEGAEQVTVKRFSWKSIDEDSHYTTPTENNPYCFKQYIQPNTFTATGDEVINTAIIVAAHLTDGQGNNADLVWIRGGYTTDGGAKNVIASAVFGQYKYYKKTAENTYKSLEPNDFEWIADEAKGYRCVAQLKSTFGTDNKLYTLVGNTATEISDGVTTVNTYLKTESNNLFARKYTDGKCYYFVEIEHVAAITGNNATAAIKGIVRNHIYDLTLNSIEGPGIPVFDPTKEVIPENPGDEKLYYLSARVNVLDWRIVTQGINFGK